jgi:hypothetical protein
VWRHSTSFLVCVPADKSTASTYEQRKNTFGGGGGVKLHGFVIMAHRHHDPDTLSPGLTGWKLDGPQNWSRRADTEAYPRRESSPSNQSLYPSQSQSHVTTDNQSVSKSWIRAPCGSRDRILIDSITKTCNLCSTKPSVAEQKVNLPSTPTIPKLRGVRWEDIMKGK